MRQITIDLDQLDRLLRVDSENRLDDFSKSEIESFILRCQVFRDQGKEISCLVKNYDTLRNLVFKMLDSINNINSRLSEMEDRDAKDND